MRTSDPYKLSFGLMGILACLGILAANYSHAASQEAFRFEQETESLSRQKIQGIISKYCGDSCEILSIGVTVDETAGENYELGFESVAGDAPKKISASSIVLEMQVDDRVGTADRDRLGKLLTNGLRNLSPAVQVKWSSVAVPQIGVSSDVEDRLKSQLQQRMQSTVQSVIDMYCPSECILGNIAVDGRLIAADEVRSVNERELVREKGGRGVLRLDNIDVDLSFDQKMTEANRTKVYNLIKAKTRFAYPVSMNVNVVDFPESPQSVLQANQDPWGLERLRQTLQIFRDLAGTKEIITQTTSKSENSTNSTSDTRSERSESLEKSEAKEIVASSTNLSKEQLSSNSSTSSKLESSELSKSNETSSSALTSDGNKTYEYALYVAAFLVFAALIVFMFMKFSSAKRDAREMMESVAATQTGRPGAYSNGVKDGNSAGGSGQTEQFHPGTVVNSERFSLRLKVEALRTEILQVVTENPKVAKDVFARMLQEDGVETTAKYVHVFGPLVVFELMSDQTLQRDLYDLSEFYHKSTYSFTDEQTLELLNQLKTRVTASEIKIMSRRRGEQFEFLQNLDSTQVFILINDEKTQLQSIVLTQLEHQKRRAVFDMYQGSARVSLMRELCRADAIPKEYLANVAKALHKKVLSRSDFDTEQLRSSDIIFDLLDKAPIQEQRVLMADLVRTNPDAARGIKLKLVTIEMLPYLKDGHLLEIVMGLERESLLAFLVGTPDHIRNLLLSKAPGELAQSWIEDINSLTGVDEATYRLAELKILSRIRTLANSGSIRLLDINDRIFAEEFLAQTNVDHNKQPLAEARNMFAA